MIQKPANDAFLKFFNENFRIFYRFLMKFLYFTYQKVSATIPSSFQYLFHLFPKSKLFQTLWFQVQNIKPKLKILGH